MPILSKNPATGEILEKFTELSPGEIDKKISRAAETFEKWRAVPVAERALAVGRLGEVLKKNREKLGENITLEIGRPVSDAATECDKTATACDFYAKNAEEFLAPETRDGGEVWYQPLGPILAVMPWNFPIWQAIRGIAPAVAAGNPVLLKHASNVPRCALAIEEICREAGFPEGLVQTLLVPAAGIEKIIADPRVAGVTLTGSEAAGRAVAAAAGAALKPVVLELGGNDPFVVFPDADLAKAAKTAVSARLRNCGQACNSPKRLLVHESVAEDFAREVLAAVAGEKVGDPADPETTIGPMVSVAARAEVVAQIEKSVAAGAKLLAGGEVLPGAGAFLTPAVLAGIAPGMPAFDDEVFGPVVAIGTFTDDADALRLANESRLGLSASVHTADPARADFFLKNLAAGAVAHGRAFSSDPRLPFGGIKTSGLGRELGREGIRAFVNVKTVVRG